MSKHELNSGDAWRDYFSDIGLPDGLVSDYSRYAEKLLASKLPVIFDWHHLAALLGVSVEYLGSVQNASEYHYRAFTIPKRSGGSRTIEAPRAALKKCQRWVLDNILGKIEIHDAAKGFVLGRSILDHAGAHIGQLPTLKMDFQDFFPSIRKRRIIHLFRSFGYSNNVSQFLASICCLNERLPQGAPTSPYLSNIICRYFDVRIFGLARKNGWTYTRYADDLAITGIGVEYGLSKFIGRVAREEGFLINSKKTRFYPLSSRRIITGLVVGDEEIGVTRSYKRELMQSVYYVNKFGLLSHISKVRRREPLFLDKLKGQVAFWHFVEPGSEKAIYLKSLLNKVRLG